METIEVRLERTNVYTRWPCAICNGWTEKDEFLAEFRYDDGDRGQVCAECLKAGSDAIPDRLLKEAERYEARAKALREWAATSKWVLPTYEEWLAANTYKPTIPEAAIVADQDIPF